MPKQIAFAKFHGAGNDFILIDDREPHFLLHFPIPQIFIAQLCDRHQGIGADGILLLQQSSVSDFRMRIFNADGSEADMCGNGIRCLAQFIRTLGWQKETCSIETSAGLYSCRFIEEDVEITMQLPKILQRQLPVPLKEKVVTISLIESGVPHAVMLVENWNEVDVLHMGREIRLHTIFNPHGVNATFARMDNSGEIEVRTYERGVENETKACGTGAASAAFLAWKELGVKGPIRMLTSSKVVLLFDFKENSNEMRMLGPAKKVFEGTLDLRGTK